MSHLITATLPSQRSGRWKLALLAITFVIVNAMAASIIFGAKPGLAWFGSGHCTMPGGFTSGQKCLAADTVGGVENAQHPYKGEIILPHGTTSISDHMILNGAGGLAGSYELQLLEDEGGALNVYQTIDYTVDSAGNTSPAAFVLNATVLHKAFVEHPVGTAGMIGYFLFITPDASMPANANCQNTVSFNGGALGSGTSAQNVRCGNPTPVPNTGKLSGHIYDCTSGEASATDIAGGTITVTVGPVTKPLHVNPITYSPVASGDYTEVATPPAGYHFVYNCGIGSTGTGALATSSPVIHVPVGGEGVGRFYVSQDTGNIVGHIYDCTSGTADTTTDVAGNGHIAVLDAAGNALAGKSGPNPINFAVSAGHYKEAATAPKDYHLVACGSSEDIATHDVVVLANGTGSTRFYVARDTGDLAAHIWDCTSGATTNEVLGGKVSAAGSTPIAEQANPLNPTPVNTDTYTVSATSPADYHLVDCAEVSKSSTRVVTVPVNGHGVAIFYVARDTGQLAGHIWDCSTGAKTTDEVTGGTLAATGPQAVGSQANPIATVTVPTGNYNVTGTAPVGYQFVVCQGSNGGNQVGVTVKIGELANAILYVARIEGSGGTSTFLPGTVTPSPTPQQSVLGASITAPNTGQDGIARAAGLSLALMVVGATLLALTVSRRSKPSPEQRLGEPFLRGKREPKGSPLSFLRLVTGGGVAVAGDAAGGARRSGLGRKKRSRKDSPKTPAL